MLGIRDSRVRVLQVLETVITPPLALPHLWGWGVHLLGPQALRPPSLTIGLPRATGWATGARLWTQGWPGQMAWLKHGAWVARARLVDSGKILLGFYEEKNVFFLGFLTFLKIILN